MLKSMINTNSYHLPPTEQSVIYARYRTQVQALYIKHNFF